MGSDPTAPPPGSRAPPSSWRETSELQVAWARGIAADPDVVALIDELPREHRQPSLLFSVTQLAGRPGDGLAASCATGWSPSGRGSRRSRASAARRRTRWVACAPLLVALDRIPGPLALLELGASAGLCLGRRPLRVPLRRRPGARRRRPAADLHDVGRGCGADRAARDRVAARGRPGPALARRPRRSSPGSRLCCRPTGRSGSPGCAPHPPASPTTRRRSWRATRSRRCPRWLAAAPAGATPVVVALGTLVYLPPPARLEVLRRSARARRPARDARAGDRAARGRGAPRGADRARADAVRARARRRAARLRVRARRSAVLAVAGGATGCRGRRRPRIAACRHPTPRPRRADELDELSLRMLDFEREWASRVGAKDAAIRAEFSIPAARYYQMLYALIDSPVALRSDPLLVRRLQRLRDARSRARAARTFRTDISDQDPS